MCRQPSYRFDLAKVCFACERGLTFSTATCLQTPGPAISAGAGRREGTAYCRRCGVDCWRAGASAGQSRSASSCSSLGWNGLVR